MKTSKKRLIFRIVSSLLLLAGLIIQSRNFLQTVKANYLVNAEELLGNKQAALAQFDFLAAEIIFDQFFIIIASVPFLYFAVRPIAKANRWWLLFPILIVTAIVLGLLQSHLGRLININYDISFFPKSQQPNYGYSDLISIRFFNLVYAFFTMILLFSLEALFFKRNSPIKSIKLTFWLSHFFIFLILVTILSFGSFSDLMFSQLFHIIPTSSILALWFTFASVFFMDTFLVVDKFSFKHFVNKFSKVYLASMGFCGLFMALLINKVVYNQFMDFLFLRVLIFSGFALLIAFAITILLYRANIGQVQKTVRLKANLEKSSSELNFLKSQVNPHFLFNSLNTLYGIALQEESLRTADGIQKLSDMMRFMLRENTADKIPVAREINYINNYIDIQSLRLTGGSDIALNIDIAEACPNSIAPMLLIPFIENAFKHGVSMQAASWIKVKLICDSQSLTLTVQNSLHKHQTRSFEESGIGIENVKKRLEILYPDTHELETREHEETYEVMLKVTLI